MVGRATLQDWSFEHVQRSANVDQNGARTARSIHGGCRQPAPSSGSDHPRPDAPLHSQSETPNELTADTIRKARRGEDVFHAKDAEDLFRQLGI